MKYILQGADITKFVKSLWLRWYGHVEKIQTSENAQKMSTATMEWTTTWEMERRSSRSFTYSTFGKSLCTHKRCWKWCPQTTVSKNWIKQLGLHTLQVLHSNRCLTTEYSETTAHFNGNFDTDNQIYVP
jgi:hypothetical protein